MKQFLQSNGILRNSTVALRTIPAKSWHLGVFVCLFRRPHYGSSRYFNNTNRLLKNVSAAFSISSEPHFMGVINFQLNYNYAVIVVEISTYGPRCTKLWLRISYLHPSVTLAFKRIASVVPPYVVHDNFK